MRWLRCLILIAALLPACGGRADPATESAGSLTGQFLIASPDMGDPRFAHTVILMVKHEREGAFGIIINRPVTERPLAAILEAIGTPEPDVQGSVRIYSGGPVQTDIGFIVHTGDYRRVETIDVAGRVAVTSNADVLRDIAHGRGPAKSLIAFGYAGWGPGQLEGELARHDWFTAPLDLKLIFDADPATVWEEAMKRRTREL